ncbi:MAG TPA: hypothetical protein VGH33_12855 [Isosphaeraceae bacterium]
MAKIPTTDFGDPLPPEVDARVLGEVETGESIVWVGRPRRGRFFLSMLPVFVFGVPWTAFAVFWVAMASQAHAPGAMGIIFPLFGLPFVAIGAGMLAAPFWAQRRAGQVAYVVTDRRVIFFEPNFPSGQKVVSLRPGEFGPLERVERDDGSGDLTFAVPIAAQVRSGSTTVARRFVGVPQVREVESLIRRGLLDKGDITA